MKKRPLHIINSVAPTRICDNGGWTDTWFAEYGRIFNIAVHPVAEVQIEVFPKDGDREQVVIHAEDFGERYALPLPITSWHRHPLLEAAIQQLGVPEQLAIEVNVHSEAPAGASTGTSAAVTVALIGALDRLKPGRMSAHEVAYLAQTIETDVLGQQCGIQDQLSAAYGGINYIEMFQYPHASVSQIQVPSRVWWELERRLLLVYLGKSHQSSQVHETVIQELEDAGPDARALQALRQTAEPSRDALYAGDFAALGKAMSQNTEAQKALHPGLVSRGAEKVIEIAASHGALGWKVNGAGGDGGSVTILCGERSVTKRAIARDVQAENELYQIIPIRLSRQGLHSWEQVA